MNPTVGLLPELSKDIMEELSSDTHEISILNGDSEDAARYIAKQKFPSISAIDIALRENSRNMTYAIALGNFDDKGVKETLMPHMNIEMIQSFLDTKDDERRKEIVSKTVEYFGKLHLAKAAAKKLEETIEEAKKLIASGEEILGKITDSNPAVTKSLQANIISLKNEIKSKHPDEKNLLKLIEKVKAESTELIGSKEIAEAQKFVDDFIKIGKKQLEEEDADEEVKAYFKDQFRNLESLKTKGNPFAMNAAVEKLGKELYEKTSKEVVAKEFSVQTVIGLMQKYILFSFFGAEDISSYAAVLKNMVDNTLSTSFREYQSGLGRFGAQLNPLETYTKILNGTLRTMVGELIIVHSKKGDIATVQLPKDCETWFYVIDKLLIKMQSKFLKIQEQETIDHASRLKASVNALNKIKSQIKDFYELQCGMDQKSATKLVEGLLFCSALEGIPDLVSQSFLKSQKVV